MLTQMDTVSAMHMTHRAAHAPHRHVAVAAAIRAQGSDAENPVAANIVGRLDTDASGDVSAAELEGTFLGRITAGDSWDTVDTDGNGALSPAEIADRHEEFVNARLEARASRAEARSVVMAAAEEV